MRRAAQPHACGFITAIPSDKDGNDTQKLLHRSRLPSWHSSARPRNPLSFVHAAHQHIWRSCHLLHKIRRSHCSPQFASQRNLVEDFASDAMLSPVLEKNTTGRCPGDVTLEKWSGGKDLATDVAVTSPLATTYVRRQETCEWYAVSQKKSLCQNKSHS